MTHPLPDQEEGHDGWDLDGWDEPCCCGCGCTECTPIPEPQCDCGDGCDNGRCTL